MPWWSMSLIYLILMVQIILGLPRFIQEMMCFWSATAGHFTQICQDRQGHSMVTERAHEIGMRPVDVVLTLPKTSRLSRI